MKGPNGVIDPFENPEIYSMSGYQRYVGEADPTEDNPNGTTHDAVDGGFGVKFSKART